MKKRNQQILLFGMGIVFIIVVGSFVGLFSGRNPDDYGITGVAPVLTINSPTGGMFEDEETINWRITISDEDGDIQSYKFVVERGLLGEQVLVEKVGLNVGYVSQSGYYTPHSGGGDYTFELTCNDEHRMKSARVDVFVESPETTTTQQQPPSGGFDAAGFELFFGVGLIVIIIKRRWKHAYKRN